MTRTSGPVTFVEGAKSAARTLRRVPFESKGIFSEKWIQDLVADHPEVIGIESLESAFAPAVTVGYELESGAGPVDVLLCSPRGMITIVETKLWRNAEMRRTVVAQILDYAKELRHWTYDDLDAESRKSMGRRGGGTALSLWERVSQHPDAKGISEAEFIDNVQRSLAAGRFLLLIVGDGVKEGVEELVATIQGAPGLQYVLRLVELRCYHLDGAADWPLIVVPSVIARTVDLVRAVVRVETKSEVGTSTNVQVEVDTLDIEARVPAADTVRAGGVAAWDEDTYFTALRTNRGDAIAEVGRRLYQWIEERGLRREWGGGPREGCFGAFVDHLGVEHHLFNVSCFGYIGIGLGKLKNTAAFQDESKRHELIDRLNQIKGARIGHERVSLNPGVSLKLLESKASFDRLIATLDWMVAEIQATALVAS